MIDDIKIGDRFIGEMNGEPLEVTDIKADTFYNSKVKNVFYRDKKGREWYVNMDTFRRAMLKRVEH